MTDILSTGKSALFAFQRALSTTSHNIANVNTEGYSRQRVDFQSVPGSGNTVGTVGGGVRISNIERMSDQFASARVSVSTSAHAEQEVHYQMASRLDNLIATEGMSVAPALNNFFNAIQDANADPASIASREVVIENTNQLADRFRTLQGQFDDAQNEVNDRTREAVKMVDEYAQSIADLNKRIVGIPSNANSQQAHDLKDQREQVVNRLSTYIDVDTLVQDNGAMSVYIGKGLSLVDDAQAQSVMTVRDSLHPDRLQIQIGSDASSLVLSSQLQGFDGANFTATRTSDGVTTNGSLPMSLDGMALTLSGTPVAGDTFLVSATGRAAGSMETKLTNADKLAMAGQLSTTSDLANLGNTRIAPATVTDAEDIGLNTPIDIIFTTETTYDIVDAGSGAVLQNGVGYDQGGEIALNGWKTTIDGDAKVGDTHRIVPNVNGRGSNSNGLALSNMQTDLLVNGTESFSDAYGSLVSNIGSNTNAAGMRATALESLRDNAIDRQQTTQGVSLDEEAIDLTRYQQAYQAAAQVISTSETLFQSILGAIR